MAQKRKHANNMGQLPLLSRAAAPTQVQLMNPDNNVASTVEDDVRLARATLSRRKSLSTGSEASSEHSIKQRKKAEPVKSACVQCQKRKTKCSGERPICRFCSDRDLTCSWDISDGMTRTADLKQKLVDANDKGKHLMQQLLSEGVVSEELRRRLGAATDRSDDLDAVIEVLRSGSDQASTMMLARLRMGASIEDLVAPLRASKSEGTSSPSLSRPARYAHSNIASVSDLSNRSRIESKSHSNSPATMSPPATSPRTFEPTPSRKDTYHQQSQADFQSSSGSDTIQYA